jgi:integrase
MSRPGANRFLLQAAYAPATRKKYLSAVQLFLDFCSEIGEDPQSFSDFDHILNDFIHHLYLSEAGKSKAVDTIYGILMLLPELKGHLPVSMLACRGWNKLCPVLSYPPLTWDLTVLIALKISIHSWPLAIGTLVAFDCFLRVGELCSLKREDVADAKDARLGVEFKGMALRLRRTKTGPNQWVTVENEEVIQLLRPLVAKTKPGHSLFPVSTSTYRRLFKSACSDLKLSSTYVPHSLRHGGATRQHLLGRSMEDILLRGRWASTRSARRYIQSGRAVLLSMEIPPGLARLAPLLSRNIITTFSLTQQHFVSGGRDNAL